jgi:hypothetical protein
LVEVAERHCRSNHIWCGYDPIHKQHGAQAVTEAFLAPTGAALPRLQRPQDAFVAGRNEFGGFCPARMVSMEHLKGPFRRRLPGLRNTFVLPMQLIETWLFENTDALEKVPATHTW